MELWSRLKMSRLLGRVGQVYSRRLEKFGPGHRAVLWKNTEGQQLRLEVLLQVVDPVAQEISVIDFGCGYGALFDLLASEPGFAGGRYVGYDLSPAMVAEAKERITDPRASIRQSAVAKEEADYTFVSGTFNLKLDADEEGWSSFVRDSLAHLWRLSRRGLAFNMLDVRTRKGDPLLYYGDPGEWLAFCRDDLGADAELVEDYPLDEWSILLRK